MLPYYSRVGWPVNEKRLELALVAVFLPPIGLFLFAWTSRPSVHWIANQIGTAIYAGSNFITIQVRVSAVHPIMHWQWY